MGERDLDFSVISASDRAKRIARDKKRWGILSKSNGETYDY
jgi:hypothetical protein